MADGQVEVDFSAQCLTDKIIISGVSECKCCLDTKRELKGIQEELSSAKLIIKLLQTEGNANEYVRYVTIEPQNLIQSKCRETKENKWIEVIPSCYRRTKQVKIDPSKRQVETENRYKVLGNLQELIEIVDGPEFGKISGVTNISRTNLKKDRKLILIGDSHARECAEKISNYLANSYEVTGYVNPSTGLEVITKSAKKKNDHMMQKDVVIVCGGATNTGAAFNVTHFELAILLVWVVGGVADNDGWVPRGLGFSEQWNVGPRSSAYFVWNSSC